TLKLYQNTLGAQIGSPLQVHTIPSCNHFIRTCETGGYGETWQVLEAKGLGEICPTYLATITDWVQERM
ncbi:MAG: hypothetical protein AAFR59_13935, partial [Bacteroidota bacterium]